MFVSRKEASRETHSVHLYFFTYVFEPFQLAAKRADFPWTHHSHGSAKAVLKQTPNVQHETSSYFVE